jgi:ubiquinone/menaquinone biosynthesis C-methylase UbiE
MSPQDLLQLVDAHEVTNKGGIYVTKGIAEKTVWDTLATLNPTHAVISAKNEADAAKKSLEQIEDIRHHLKPTDVLLDYGAGYGRVAQYLLPKMPIGGYVAVDSAYEMLTLFKQRYTGSSEEQATPLLLVNADIHTIPLKNQTVDVVLVSAVFLHNHKDVVTRAMEELKRVLKPGGTLLVYASFPRSATIMGIQGLAYQVFLNFLGKPFKNGPVRYYRRSEILKLVEDFEEVELRPVGFSVVPKSIIFLPRILDKVYRLGFANPINGILEKITPARLKPYFAVHYDVIAKR